MKVPTGREVVVSLVFTAGRLEVVQLDKFYRDYFLQNPNETYCCGALRSRSIVPPGCVE